MNREFFWKLFRFAIVGLVVMICFMALNWLFGRFLTEKHAFLAAYPPALCVHYLLSKRWTFRDTTSTDRRKITGYILTVVVTFIIQWTAFNAVRQWGELPAWSAAGIANLVQMAASFFLMQYRVFRRKPIADPVN